MRVPTFIFFLLTMGLGGTISTFSQNVNPQYLNGVIYIKVRDTSDVQLVPYDNSIAELNELISWYDIMAIEQPFRGFNLTLDKTYRLTFTLIEGADDLLEKLRALYFVEYAEKLPLYRAEYIPNDLDPSQWNLVKVNAIRAWDISKGSNEIMVAIVDNAVRITHHDLKANVWINTGENPDNLLDDDADGYIDDVNGYDVADNDNNPNPPFTTVDASPFSHGTHVAGIVSAVTDNGRGIASIGFNLKIIAVKCSPDLSSGEILTHPYEGIIYGIRAGARVINMSFGGSEPSLTGQNLMNLAHAEGIILVAAAGNDDNETLSYPAAYNYVISVGSTDASDVKSDFSNYGTTIDLMAPGSFIMSTLAGTDDSYGVLSGTSMASPLIAGTAGLILSFNPLFIPDSVESFLKEGCEKIDAVNPGYEGKLGAGRANAYNSLLIASSSLANTEEPAELIVYPNPNHGLFFIQFGKGDTMDKEVMIADILGRIIYEKKFSASDSKKQKMFFPDLADGMYFVRVKKLNGTVTKKIIVQ